MAADFGAITNVVDPRHRVGFISGKAMGNTTRIVDASIQALFEGKTVAARDHYATIEACNDVMYRIIRRLRTEHPDVKYTVHKGFRLIKLEEGWQQK